MDLTQEFILRHIEMFYGDIEDEKFNGISCLENITIEQDFDITKTKYYLIIKQKFIKKVYVKIKNRWQLAENLASKDNTNEYWILLDFDNKCEKIKFEIENNLTDDIVLPVEFIDADKEAYYKKLEEEKARICEEKRQELLKNLHYGIISGQNVLNVIFDTVNSKVAKTKVLLTYWLHDKYLTICEKVLGKNEHWAAFTDLGFANYSIVIEQYDKNGSLIVKTDNIQCSVKR